MAKGNLNKNEKTAPKLPQHENLLSYGSLSTKIKIPRCGPRFINFPKTVPCEVNLALQCSHLEVLLLSKFGQLMHILGLLGMYFDAVVVKVKTFLL